MSNMELMLGWTIIDSVGSSWTLSVHLIQSKSNSNWSLCMPRYDLLLVQLKPTLKFHKGDNMNWKMPDNSDTRYRRFYLKIYWERK